MLGIRKGMVHVLSAFDVGHSIDLARSKSAATELTETARIRHKGHAPNYFQFDPPPLRMTHEAAPVEIGSLRTTGSVDLTVYDFGGVTVEHTIPFTGTFEELVGLSVALAGTDRFQRDARKHAAHLVEVIEHAVDRPSMAEPMEDYLVFRIEEIEGLERLEDLWTTHAAAAARLLRSERDELSEQEVADAMSTRVSFGSGDVALLDWSAALLVDREPEDVLSVLDFANLQLLEMRYLDSALDAALDRSYEAVSRPRPLRILGLTRWSRTELAKVARFEVDGAILFEQVGNALKLVGDQYLARVYRATSQRFRLAEWNSGILRKLEAIESIYRKLQDRSSAARAEALEWIIIALIAAEILLGVLSVRKG